MRTGRIYIIKNTVNDKVYIGQTTMTAYQRFQSHIKPSNVEAKSSYKLYDAMKKYGTDKFYVETLEEDVPIDKLNEREIKWIADYDSFNNGYNGNPGGDGRIINCINHEAEVLELAKKGISTPKIAEMFGVHNATIIRTLHKLGFYYRVDPAEICALAEEGLSNDEIADLLGCHSKTVSRALVRTGNRKHRLPIKFREQFDYDSMREDYYNQMPIGEICEKYGISKTSFYRIKSNENFDTRPQIYKHKIRYRN